MKALISPLEIKTIRYITKFVNDEPQYKVITDCLRVVEVKTDNEVFEVAPPLYWVDCPNECEPNTWYFKDGLHKIPKDESSLDEVEIE